MKQNFSAHPEVKPIALNDEAKQQPSQKWKGLSSMKRVSTNSLSWASSKMSRIVNAMEEEDNEDDDSISQQENNYSSNESNSVSSGFVSARNQYIVDQQKKFGKSYNPNNDK